MMSESTKRIINESFNEEFCDALEYRLTRFFAQSADSKLKGFWCDGVVLPPEDSKPVKGGVNDTLTILTKAWLGYDGQGEYEMTIRLGQCALRRYAEGVDLAACIPGEESLDWVTVNMDNKTIELQLK
jgi:hypothetical protein